WGALIDLALFRKDRDKTEALLTEAEKEGDAVELRLGRARLSALDKPKDLDKKLEGLDRDLERFDTENQARLLAGLAEVYFRAGYLDQTRRLCSRLAKNPLHQQDLRLRLLVFDLALRDGKETATKDALAELRDAEQGGGVFTRFGTAVWLIRQARQEKEK